MGRFIKHFILKYNHQNYIFEYFFILVSKNTDTPQGGIGVYASLRLPVFYDRLSEVRH